MGRHKRFRPSKFPTPRNPGKKKYTEENLYILDRFSESDLRTWENRKEDVLKYYWEYYSELAHQRTRIKDDLFTALIEASAGGITYGNWHRTVRVKHILDPLSAKGSILSPSGGRFNFGSIEESKFPPFPALYLAVDSKTAIQEGLAQAYRQAPGQTPLDFALTSDTSFADYRVKFSLENIIDLHDPNSLRPFVKLIKNFTLPDSLKAQAKKLDVAPPTVVQSVKELMKNLHASDWRKASAQFDVPAGCQIFGQLVEGAGIEGILYASKFTGQDCIAIFPRNLENSNSFIELADSAVEEIRLRRIDQHSWPKAV